ncbi:MAG: patatin-like phospholipase family protein [Legionellales bacterium]
MFKVFFTINHAIAARIRIVSFISLIMVILFLQGCARTESYNPLPAKLENQVEVPGFHDVRGWGDEHSKSLQKSISLAAKQEMAHNHGRLKSEINSLVLSGGGRDGAFGAGLLCGWSKTGKRPQFKVVTGISTGALIAPYAFLGPEYDNQLKKAYTTISDKDIYHKYSNLEILLSLANLFPAVSLADNKPLIKLIEKSIDQNLLNKIASEHLKGRRLFVGTTQFNAQRLVIWDMGAIAASKSSQAVSLFRKVLLASASLPASCPPQYFTVKAKGKMYNEMHVDGGIESQAIFSENAILPHKILESEAKNLKGHKRTHHLYVIRNRKISPEWQNVKPQLKSIIFHAIDSLTKSQGIGDLFRIYTYVKRDNIDYNLAYIPRDFSIEAKTEFDNQYMNSLFARGYAMGRAGYAWNKYPPDYTPIDKPF